MLRRHRASLPDVDPAFNKTPHETLDPAFTGDDPGPTVESLFDPSLHTAEKVLEHAAALDAECLEALASAETAGKARKGVLEALAKLSSEKEKEADEPGDPGEPGEPGEPEGLF